jgi:hypothetical protein
MDDSNDSPPPAFDPNARVSEFFSEAVASAIDAEGYDPSDESKAYVSSLLVDYARPVGNLRPLLSEPVGLALLSALQSSSAERFNRLRTLGDEVLFVSGFFGEHYSHAGLELTYATELGAVAYDNAAQMLKRVSRNSRGPDVFSELASKFDMFVQLLNTVADTLAARSSRSQTSLLDLYERWRRSGSRALGEALALEGVAPLLGDKTVH